jgi:sirohydrochlorin cobaltochelatase
MAKNLQDPSELKALELRIKTLLPETYQDSYQDVKPVSMGSAALKYTPDGLVAWDEIWGSFCDLAMAGGPPHKGTLLQPGTQSEIDAQPERYEEVVQHLCRGIEMVTDFIAEPSPVPGWVRVNCLNQGAAGWLLRAITMENISVRGKGLELDLPAGPSYRLEKEIKNVITAIAKTNHYWFGHTTQAQRGKVRNLLAAMEAESPLLQPWSPSHDRESPPPDTAREAVSQNVHRLIGLRPSNPHYSGWVGIEYLDVPSAIWMMRALVASNVLSRREDTVLFLPLDPVHDKTGEKIIPIVVRLHAFAPAPSPS